PFRIHNSAFVFAFAAALAVWIAGCQTPPKETRSTGGRNLAVTDVRGRLEYLARVRDQQQDSKVGAGNTSFKESIFEENIRLETDGSVYHPNLLEFTLAGLFGLQQRDFEQTSDGQTRTSGGDGDVFEFDFEGHFLKKKPYPGTVYARRYRSLVPRPFLSSLQTTTTNYGFVWQYVDPKTPTSLQFNSTDVRLDPLDKQEKPGRQKNEELRFETAYKFSEYNELTFLYNRRSVEEEPFALAYDSDELTLAHRLDFGDRRQHRLDSELNVFDQKGTFDVERTRFREILRLSHSETLRSWYRLELLDRTQGSLSGVPPIGEKSTYLSGTVEHQLYESLVSQFFAFVQQQDYDSGLEILRYGMQPGFDYRKKNPWGVLLANYNVRIQREDRSGGALDMEVVDETRTFQDPEPITLNNPKIVVSSIFITAEDRTTTYREGSDYRVRQVGDFVEIERVPTGRIQDGQTVLVDYVFVLGGDFSLDTVAHNFNIRQNFAFGLSPYYRLREQDQELSPEDATGITPEDITAHTIGVEYQRGPLRATAEFEDHDSTIVPFEAVRLSADLTHKFDAGGTARLKARWTDVERSAPQIRETEFFTVEGRYRHTIKKALTVEGAVLYRTQQDTLSTDNQGVNVDLALEWLYRQTEVRVTYQLGRFEDDFAKNRTSSLYVQIRRRF
ncbi:MAG: hypothetical protein AAB363_08225, partial [Planctomycetota bacterium]